jgi:dTMP kinase
MTTQFPGYFISFEGIDGAGKSTHIDAFAVLLKERYPDREVVMTREPGGTQLGEQLRALLLDAPMNLETEALLMFAARREHIAQGGGRGLSLEKLNDLERWVQGRPDGSILQPNLTFLFDLPGSIAEARRSKVRAPDKFEKMDLDFFEKVRQEYLRRAKADPSRFYLVDATRTPEVIWNDIEALEFKL